VLNRSRPFEVGFLRCAPSMGAMVSPDWPRNPLRLEPPSAAPHLGWCGGGRRGFSRPSYAAYCAHPRPGLRRGLCRRGSLPPASVSRAHDNRRGAHRWRRLRWSLRRGAQCGIRNDLDFGDTALVRTADQELVTEFFDHGSRLGYAAHHLHDEATKRVVFTRIR
jgi:hypothetical protein